MKKSFKFLLLTLILIDVFSISASSVNSANEEELAILQSVLNPNNDSNENGGIATTRKRKAKINTLSSTDNFLVDFDFDYDFDDKNMSVVELAVIVGAHNESQNQKIDRLEKVIKSFKASELAKKKGL